MELMKSADGLGSYLEALVQVPVRSEVMALAETLKLDVIAYSSPINLYNKVDVKKVDEALGLAIRIGSALDS